MLRAFVALEILSRSVLDSLVEMQRELSATGADLKGVERENLHFTVRFLGEVSDSQVSDIGSRLRALTLKGGEVEVRGVGAFPDASRPRVVWVGVAPEHEAMVAAIAVPVVDALAGVGEPDARPFVAHVTLGRVRSQRNSKGLSNLIGASAGRSFGVTRLASLKLKSSRLTPQGPVYSDLGEYPLR